MRTGIKGFLLLLLMCSFSVNAAFYCKTNLNAVLVYGDGTINVNHQARGDYTIICNLNQEYKGVSMQTCAMWTSMLLNLKKANQPAFFYYNSSANFNSCADLPTYSSAPIPVYIGDRG